MNDMIPDAALVAAAKVLYADNMSNHSGDNAPQIIDACEAVVKKILEAAAPHMMADRKVMAGVLAAHQIKTGDRGMSPRCSCGWLGQVFGNDFREDFITHQADMLDVQQKATK